VSGTADFPHMDDALSPFDEVLDSEWIDYHWDRARVRLTVRDDLKHPNGGLHGGVIHSIVEGIASRGTTAAMGPEGMLCLVQGIEVSLLRPIYEGFVEARAVARHRGRASWVWTVDVVDGGERLCALGKVTIAVRPAPADGVAQGETRVGASR
jgi:1,4-dihydroxy-2-naphthoyl-CoA hydrolase